MLFVVIENKRKGEEGQENPAAKTKRIETSPCSTDLIVLGLPWKSTEDDLKKYFAQFGELLLVQVIQLVYHTLGQLFCRCFSM